MRCAQSDIRHDCTSQYLRTKPEHEIHTKTDHTDDLAINIDPCDGVLRFTGPWIARPQEGETSEPSIQYVPLEGTIDSPPRMFKTAVIVDKMPLVHTRQLFPFDSDGKLWRRF